MNEKEAETIQNIINRKIPIRSIDKAPVERRVPVKNFPIDNIAPILAPIKVTSKLPPPTIQIYDFSGGLNTSVSPFLMKPNQARECYNWDLGIVPGALTKRKGYVALIDSLNWDKPIYGIYGYTARNAEKRLFSVVCQPADSLFLGLGELVISDPYAYMPDTASPEHSYIYTGETPSWAMWKNDVFLSNGRQKPIIWRDGRATELMIAAPGEPLIIPINDTGTNGSLNGEYRYILKAASLCGGAIVSFSPPDSGFETWTDTNTLTNWTEVGGAYYALEKDSTAEYSGVWCAKMTEDGSGNEIIGLKDTIDVTAGLNYKVSVYVKTDLTYMSKHIGIDIFSIPGNVSLYYDYVNDYTTEWQHISGSFLATDTTDSLEVYLWVKNASSNGQKFYFDSISIQSIVPDSALESYVSPPVKAYNEKMLLTNFPFHGQTHTGGPDSANWNDITLKLFRTRANPSLWTLDDTLFLVAEYENLLNSELDTLRIIDSIPDDSLGAGSHTEITIPNFDRLGRDTTGTVTGNRVGAPTWVADYGVANSVPYWTDGAHNDSGFGDSNAICVFYAMTYLDAILGWESDTSRSLFIWLDTTWIDRDSAFIIGLPPLPPNGDHLIRNLYKGYGYVLTADTLAGLQVAAIDTVIEEPRWPITFEPTDEWPHPFPSRPPDTTYKPIYYLDTNLSDLYLLATIKDSSIKTFVDTLAWDTLTNREKYWGAWFPPMLNNVRSFDDRLWGYYGSIVYWSELDKGGVWNPFKSISLNADDGDEITGIMPMRQYIKVFKNYSQYVIEWNQSTHLYERIWTVDGIGCAAPRSLIAYNNGMVYLSHIGVIYETELAYKDKSSKYGLISEPIADLIDYSTAEKRTAVGYIDNDKYYLSFPAKDTTYVYDFKVGGWSINSYAPAQVTFYDTTKNSYIAPSKDMLFIKDDDDALYKADTGVTDDGTIYSAYWKSGPLGIGSPFEKSISKIGIYYGEDHANVIFARTLLFYTYDDMDSGFVDSTYQIVKDVYTIKNLGIYTANYWYLKVWVGIGAAINIMQINGFDIWLENKGFPTMK